MAYFSHAFRKMFLGTKSGSQEVDPMQFVQAFAGIFPTSLLVQAGIDHGYITSEFKNFGGTDIIKSSDLQYYGMGPGTFAFFDKDTYEIQHEAPDTCCPLVLASASIRTEDKLGQFHGGYSESNKSKIINPKYIQEYYRVNPCVPQQSVISIGTTPYTINLNTPDATCCKTFYCGETYYLRIDVKGSPTLRALNHNAYHTLDAYTGCCATDIPAPVDPTLVYNIWAQQVITTEYLRPYILPVVFDYTGAPWYAPNSTVDPLSGTAIPVFTCTADGLDYPQTWNNYALSDQAIAWTEATPCLAGMRLFGAFVETKFGNCSFQVSDFYEKEPVRIFASLVDYTGDPCVFEGLCVYHECDGYTGQGFGETVIRDLILSESYLTNFFHSDIRIREITGGNSVFNVIDRLTPVNGALYTRYFILHSVPRFNNPTGTFDNDRYLLDIVVAEADPTNPVGSVEFEAFMAKWLKTCGACNAAVDIKTCIGTCNVTPPNEQEGN